MGSRVSQWLYSISGGWTTLTVFAIFVIFIITVLPDQAAKAEEYSKGIGGPDTSLFYTPEQLFAMAEAYGEAGRQAFILARVTFDVVFPFIYGAFLITAISWFFNQINPAQTKLRLLNLVPILGVIFDFLENIATSTVMATYPKEQILAAGVAPVATILKWSFLFDSFIILLGLVILFLVKKIRSHFGKQNTMVE